MYNTTAFTLTGFRITRELGTVRGIVVRSRSVIGNFGASIQTLFGGDITLYTDLCERARQDAYERMCAHAQALGANAIIGLRYDATEIAPSVTEVLCYGTAVVVEPA
ncbi:MAG: YbjQ family protein [Lacunisphaera sp.]